MTIKAPAPLPSPNYEELKQHLEAGMRSMEENEGHPGKDFAHYTFEKAMEVVYGPNIWDWFNANVSES